MMVLLNPLALFALAAAAAPIVVHLLLRHRAPRTVVPTVRFVPRLSPQSIRLRRPSDLPLLLVRVAIVACAALALAGPLVLTDARRGAWNERIARAVIVDSSDGAGVSRLSEALQAERLGSDPHREIDTGDVRVALRRAANWLQRSPPARREIVVFSPFPYGALTQADLAVVPEDTGLRFIRTENRATPEPFRGRLVAAEGVRASEARLDGAATVVRYGSAAPPAAEGLQIRARPADAAAVARLRRVIGRAGVTAADPGRPVSVRFLGGEPHTAAETPHPETAAAALRLVQDETIASLPVVVSASAHELRVEADVEAASLDAAAIIRAALDAPLDPERFMRHEVASIPDATLQAWSREPAMTSPDNWSQSDRSDARWFWLTALLLLVVETIMRRRQEQPLAEATADAA